MYAGASAPRASPAPRRSPRRSAAVGAGTGAGIARAKRVMATRPRRLRAPGSNHPRAPAPRAFRLRVGILASGRSATLPDHGQENRAPSSSRLRADRGCAAFRAARIPIRPRRSRRRAAGAGTGRRGSGRREARYATRPRRLRPSGSHRPAQPRHVRAGCASASRCRGRGDVPGSRHDRFRPAFSTFAFVLPILAVLL
jgi:hypothetical protein